MAYDKALAGRIETLLADLDGIEPRRMFGAICYLLNGNICVGVWKDNLLIRAGADKAEYLLGKPGISPFDVTGRPMRGWLLAAPEVVASDADLERHVRLGVEFASTLPPK